MENTIHTYQRRFWISHLNAQRLALLNRPFIKTNQKYDDPEAPLGGIRKICNDLLLTNERFRSACKRGQTVNLGRILQEALELQKLYSMFISTPMNERLMECAGQERIRKKIYSTSRNTRYCQLVALATLLHARIPANQIAVEQLIDEAKVLQKEVSKIYKNIVDAFSCLQSRDIQQCILNTGNTVPVFANSQYKVWHAITTTNTRLRIECRGDCTIVKIHDNPYSVMQVGSSSIIYAGVIEDGQVKGLGALIITSYLYFANFVDGIPSTHVYMCNYNSWRRFVVKCVKYTYMDDQSPFVTNIQDCTHHVLYMKNDGIFRRRPTIVSSICIDDGPKEIKFGHVGIAQTMVKAFRESYEVTTCYKDKYQAHVFENMSTHKKFEAVMTFDGDIAHEIRFRIVQGDRDCKDYAFDCIKRFVRSSVKLAHEEILNLVEDSSSSFSILKTGAQDLIPIIISHLKRISYPGLEYDDNDDENLGEVVEYGGRLKRKHDLIETPSLMFA